jgi:hypothetical protein
LTTRAAPWPNHGVARARNGSGDRRKRAARAAGLGLAALLAAAAACAGNAPKARIAPEHVGAPGVRGFLLGPANLAISLHSELVGGVEPVQQAIAAYIDVHGRSVERLSLQDGRRLWDEAIAEARQSGARLRFETTVALFTKRLAETRDFDALVLPSLLYDFTRIRHRKAAWDGVERRMRLMKVPYQKAGRTDNVMMRLMPALGMAGSAAVTSLHLVVLTREGVKVFEGRGGLELVQEIEVKSVDHSYRIDLHARGDLFQDADALREGVQIAFTPYLSPPPEQ